MKTWYRLALALWTAIALCGGFAIGRRCPQKRPSEPPKVKTDTFYVHDTITFTKPVSEKRKPIGTALVPIADTVRIRDTLFLPLEREQVVWRDSLSAVYASGVRTQIDSVRHFISERVIVKEIPAITIKKTRWALGVQVGYGVQVGGQWQASPYVGVGVSYNLLSW